MEMNTTTRVGLAGVSAVSTAILYAEGVLKNGWIEVLLLIPVVWVLLSRKPRPLLLNLLLSLIGICLTITLADLLLRPLLDRRLNYTPLNVYSHKFPPLPIVGRWDPGLHLVDILYGDLAAIAGVPTLRQYRRIVFETDHAGFRNAAVPSQIGVLVLGDSFAAGWGTTQEAIFSEVLKKKYGAQTYNLGFPGGPYDQYVNFAIEWPRLQFSEHRTLIWTIYTGNDLDDAGGEVWEIEALPWRSKLGQWQVQYRTFRNRSPLNRLMEQVRGWYFRVSRGTYPVLGKTLPDGQPILFRPTEEDWALRPKETVKTHPNFAKLRLTFSAMQRLAAARSIEPAVLILPTKNEVYQWLVERRSPAPDDQRSSGFAQAILDMCGEVRLRCWDTKPYLVREAQSLFAVSEELLWWLDDTHIGERGHEALAGFIAEEILRLDVVGNTKGSPSKVGTKQSE
jgi:hypothetical protein